ncbi:hypothetical protein PoB_002429600 [Plakobranchus ocellatus]|uniref:Uncharacterized protein n=1 Tax=Plakobranchus ocellatus TaxID=259542 RepID=A0AAV3ZEY1_9GAST|nr:hypothetical protein PoB_002429600 [Plakobranchus ocellatus]
MNPWLWNFNEQRQQLQWDRQRQQQLFAMGGNYPQRLQSPWNGPIYAPGLLQKQPLLIGLNQNLRQQAQARPPQKQPLLSGFGQNQRQQAQAPLPQKQPLLNGLNQNQSQQAQALSNDIYDVDELRLARKSFGGFLEQLPSFNKSWRPLQQDDLPNMWEGESGMMEHIVEPFPLPAKGEITPGTSICDPDTLAGPAQRADPETSVTEKPSLQEIQDIPRTAPSESDTHIPSNIVEVSDEDSDVEIVRSSPSQTSSTSSKAILIQNNPQKSRHKRKKTKKKPAVG